MPSVKCVHCGAANDPEKTAGYCDNCGKKLPDIHAIRGSGSPEPPAGFRAGSGPSAGAPGEWHHEPISRAAETDYGAVPLYRTNGFCSTIAGAHACVMVVGFCCFAPVMLLGILTTPAVIAVCIVVLTGPVYYNKRRKDGTLKTWSPGNKVAAVILLILFVGGYAGFVYYLILSGKLG
jgi:hypothetical protein